MEAKNKAESHEQKIVSLVESPNEIGILKRYADNNSNDPDAKMFLEICNEACYRILTKEYDVFKKEVCESEKLLTQEEKNKEISKVIFIRAMTRSFFKFIKSTLPVALADFKKFEEIFLIIFDEMPELISLLEEYSEHTKDPLQKKLRQICWKAREGVLE